MRSSGPGGACGHGWRRRRGALRGALALALALLPAACILAPPGTSASASGSSSSGETGESASASASAGDAPSLTIATFNVRRFFDTVCDSGACGPGDFEEAPSLAAFESRADQIAAAIAELEADVVLLQEIENQTCIDALLTRLPEFSAGYLGEQGYAASLDTAVLVALPTLAVITHQDDEFPHPDGGLTSFTRDLLEVHVNVEGERVIVFAAHFRSKVDDDPGRRLAEGQRAGEWIAQRASEYPAATIVLGGDLNDVPTSPPLQALESSGPLLRVASELADDTTYIYGGKASALDHLFQSLSAAGAAIPGSAKIFRSPTAWDGGGWGGSDHAALRASFTVGE